MSIPNYLVVEHAKAVASAVKDGAPPSVFAELDALTDDQRMEVFMVYCTHCGSANSRCMCSNDC